MKRWFVARLGFYEEPEDQGGSQVPKILAYPNTLMLRQWTRPGLNFAFGRMATDNVAQFAADNDVYVLPDTVMDMSVGSIPVAVRNTMKARFEAAGFQYANVKTAWTVRQLLRYLSDQVQPGIETEANDGSDPWA